MSDDAIATADALYDRWFNLADTDRDGRLTGPDARAFFGRSDLPQRTLAAVWGLSDVQRKGYLDVLEFRRAVKLISLAQRGIDITDHELVAQELKLGVPPPQLHGIPTAASAIDVVIGDLSLKDAQYSPPKPSSNIFSRRKSQKKVSTKLTTSIIDGLKALYMKKVKPLEQAFNFGDFFSPLLQEGDFHAKPSVLLLGQYSSGKTTFIQHLLNKGYPGMNIGPEPTTDRFVVVEHGIDDRRVPGNTLAVQTDKPYTGLQQFGTLFLGRFEGAETPSKLLEEISIVDTPGILAGEKQREMSRGYDFIRVCNWFIARCDAILILFDPYKLDISDEMRAVIQTLRGHDDKVKVVLNKADTIDQQQLMRVYGALMWSLGKVFGSPEVVRVYVGSFNRPGVPIREDVNPHGKDLFEAEHADLLDDLYEIPKRSCDRKINEFVKRMRALRIHMLIMGHLRKSLPTFGQKKAQEKILANLDQHFRQVMQENHLPLGDFPDVNRFAQILRGWDISQFPKLDKKAIKTIEDVLHVDIPALTKQFDNPYADPR